MWETMDKNVIAETMLLLKGPPPSVLEGYIDAAERKARFMRDAARQR
jgi:hypothetical protein